MRRWLIVLLAASSCVRLDVQQRSNAPPVADAGEDFAAAGGEQVSLTGSSRDPDDDATTVRWSQLAGDPIELSSWTAPEVTFLAPPRAQTLVLQLVANDGVVDSEPDLLRIAVVFNQPPIANAGEAAEVPNLQPVRLLGGGADPDGDTITSYQWSVVSGPAGAELTGLLSAADVRNPFFTPRAKGDYVVALIVSDGEAWSEPAEVLVMATNNPPVAQATVTPDPIFSGRYNLSGLGSTDPDGDALTSFAWSLRETPTGGVLSFVDGVTTQPLVAVELAGRGVFALGLTVTDADGTASEPVEIRLLGNRAPVVALAQTTVTTVEGLTADLDASATIDPDGDPFTLIWIRSAGSTAFPSFLSGPTPSVLMPSLDTVLASGDNWADYDVVAFDGMLESQPQTIRLHVLPSAANFVVVGSGASAADGPGCGTIAAPCATLSGALAVVDPDGDHYGDGRTVLVTAAAVAESFPTGGNGDYQFIVWAGSTSLLGGRHPETFARDTPSTVSITHTGGSCLGTIAALQLGAETGAEVQVDNLVVQFFSACGNYGQLSAVKCLNCAARLTGVSFVRSQNGGGENIGLLVAGGVAAPVCSGCDLFASQGFLAPSALRVSNGGSIHLVDSELRSTTTSAGAVVRLDLGSTLTAERTRFTLTGGPSTQTEAGVILATGSNLQLTNCVVANLAAPNLAAVSQRNGGLAALTHNTIVGVGDTSGTGAAVSLSGSAVLFGNLLTGAPVGVHLTNTAAASATLFANAISATAGALVRCTATDVIDAAGLNVAPGAGCNGSTGTWSGNLAAACALVNPLIGDFHLAMPQTNPCHDSGLAESPSGAPPADDLDREVRPEGAGFDIGADEAL